MLTALFNIFVFPGLAFLVIFGWLAQYLDRKVHARLQNRVGPPWFQTFADLIKLLGKEDIVPCDANKHMFRTAPLFALTSVVTAFLYIPLWKNIKQSYSPVVALELVRSFIAHPPAAACTSHVAPELIREPTVEDVPTVRYSKSIALSADDAKGKLASSFP